MALSPGILHGIEIKVRFDPTPRRQSPTILQSQMRTLDPSEVTVTEVEDVPGSNLPALPTKP